MAYLDYPGLTLFKSKLDQQLENELNTFVTKTMPESSVVTFEDGADDLPLKELKVKIEPKQDLHGYDKPWVGGAGKNLLKYDINWLKENNTTGTWNENVYTANGISYTLVYDNDGNIIAIHISGSSSYNPRLVLYNGSLDVGTSYKLCKFGENCRIYLDGNQINSNSTDYTFTAQEGTYNISINQGQSPTAGNRTPMLIKSSETDETFAPYTNICPITGWTEAKVARTGKNLLNTATSTAGKGINSSGDLYNNDHMSASEFIPVVAGKSYVLSAKSGFASQLTRRIYGYKANKTVDSSLIVINEGISVGTQYTRSFTIPEGSTIAYVRIGYATLDTEIMVEFGDTRTDYEAFKRNDTYSITFPASAGTVYGGELTINRDGSGELAIDRLYGSVPECNRVGDSTIAGSTGEWAEFVLTGYDYIKQYDPALCSHGGSCTYANRGKLHEFFISANNKLSCFVKSGSTKEEVTALFSGATFVAPRQNIRRCSLTTTQVRSLLGLNHIWADTGDITSLTYYKHNPVSYELVAGYDGDARSKAAQINIAAEENTTATANHAVGDVFIVNDRLYEATTAITSGETIAEGINVEPITLKEYADKAAEVATMEEINSIIQAYDA